MTKKPRLKLHLDGSVSAVIGRTTGNPDVAYMQVMVRCFLDRIHGQGLTVAEWARKRDIDVGVVRRIVNGQLVGRRGETRKVVKAMGIRPLPQWRQRTGITAPGRG